MILFWKKSTLYFMHKDLAVTIIRDSDKYPIRKNVQGNIKVLSS